MISKIGNNDSAWNSEAAHFKEDDGDAAAGEWRNRPNPKRKLSEKDAEDISACGSGIRPSPEEGLIKGKIWSRHHGPFRHTRSVESTLYHLMQIGSLEGHGTQRLRNPMFTNMRDEAVQKRCVPIPRQTRTRLMVVGTWRTDYPIAMGCSGWGSD